MSGDELSKSGWAAVSERERTELGNQNSKVHHWWPRALHKYWEQAGKISWIEPNSDLGSMSVKNDKIGYIHHGHTVRIDQLSPEGVRTEDKINYEPIFGDVDNSIPEIVTFCKLSSFPSWRWREILKFLIRAKKAFHRDQTVAKVVEIDPALASKVALLVLSIVERCPGNRAKFERTINRFWNNGLEQNQVKPIVASNVVRDWKAKAAALDGRFQGIDLTILFSPYENFMFGDGIANNIEMKYFDQGGKLMEIVVGKGYFPLTPKICICLSLTVRDSNKFPHRCLSTLVVPDQVQEINIASSCASVGKLHFLGTIPTLTPQFQREARQQHSISTLTVTSFLEQQFETLPLTPTAPPPSPPARNPQTAGAARTALTSTPGGTERR